MVAGPNKDTGAKRQIAISRYRSANEMIAAAAILLVLIKHWTAFMEHKHSTGGLFFWYTLLVCFALGWFWSVLR